MAAIETDPCEHSHTALLLCNFWMDSSGELLSVDDLGRAIPCACCLGLGAGMPPIGLGVAIGTAPFIPTSCFAAGACCGAPSSSSSCKGAVGGIPMPTSPPFRNGFRRAYPIITPRPPSPISNSFFFACHVWVNCSGHSAHSEPYNDDELHTHTQHPRRALGKRPPAPEPQVEGFRGQEPCARWPGTPGSWLAGHFPWVLVWTGVCYWHGVGGFMFNSPSSGFRGQARFGFSARGRRGRPDLSRSAVRRGL